MLGIVLSTSAVALLGWQAWSLASMERALGELRRVVLAPIVTRPLAHIDTDRADEPTLPVIHLTEGGHTRDLDRCDGTFTELGEYRSPGVLPVYGAHNICGGDIILDWEIGQEVRVAGSPTVYVVVDERRTPKAGKVSMLVGMEGELLLQTCFYGQDKMRFLALAPAR